MRRTIEQINEKIARGDVVVLTAEEAARLRESEGTKAIAQRVDVVTTGTFGMMCSSGLFLNTGHTDPPAKLQRVFLNGVEAHGGLAAVDLYMGATQASESDPRYGGAHVIEALLRGERVRLSARGARTDCYPREHVEAEITLKDINQAFLFNPRNLYQNYPAATNSSERVLYTYMGKLLPGYGNVMYATSGELSPLLKDPDLRTIGIGTRVFLGGAIGYVAWEGTQFNASPMRDESGLPLTPGATLALVGNLKEMSAEFLRAAYIPGYGISLFLGIGTAIPILDEDIAESASRPDSLIKTAILDYGIPRRARPRVKLVSYRELRSGYVEIMGKPVKTGSRTSMRLSRKVAETLREWIRRGVFRLSERTAPLPVDGQIRNLEA
ncbi:MAG: homocysteine biosynthesis protein [candidate division WOR-3 bacterium]